MAAPDPTLTDRPDPLAAWHGIPTRDRRLPGVAIGPALVLDTEGVVISQRTVPADHIETEIARLATGLAQSADDARHRQQVLTERLGQDIGDIFHGHANLYADANLRRRVETLIREQHYTAEYAVSRYIRSIVKFLDEQTSNDMALRLRADFLDLEKHVLARLMGTGDDGASRWPRSRSSS